MVEKLTGKIEEYLKTELFDPIEMEDTFLRFLLIKLTDSLHCMSQIKRRL